MAQLAHKLVWYAVLLATTAYAWRRGGKDEKLVTITMLVASLLITFIFPNPMVGLDAVATVGISVLGTAIYFWVALTTDRWWPICATSFQLISTAALVMLALDPTLRPIAAYVNSEAWDYFTLAAVALGVRYEASTFTGAARPSVSSSEP